MTTTERIIALRKAGYKVRTISKKTKKTDEEVMTVLKEAGLTDRDFHDAQYKRRFGISWDEAAEKCVKLYQKGMLMRDISAQTGYPYADVRLALKEAGISPSGKHAITGVEDPEIRTEKILELRKKGLAYNKIAARLGLSTSIVYRTCIDNGLGGDPREERLKEVTPKIIAMYQAYVPSKQIAATSGVCVSTVRAILRSSGVYRKTETKEKRDADMRKLYKDGVTMEELSERFHLSERTVWRICREGGK